MTPRAGFALVVAGAALLGTSGTVSRLFYEQGGTPWTLVWLRYLLSLPVFIALARWRGGPAPRGRTLLLALGLGAFQVGASLSLLEGFARAPVGLVVLLFYVYPLLVCLGAALGFGVRLGRLRILALAGGLAGIALIAGSPDAVSGVGIALGLLAAVCVSGAILLGRELMARRAVSPQWLNACMACGAVAGLLAATPATPPSLAFEPRGWLLVASMVLGSGVLGLSLFYAGVSRVGAPTASLLGNVEPLTGVLLGYAVLGETLSGLQLAGGGLILVGVIALGATAGSDRRSTRPKRPLPGRTA